MKLPGLLEQELDGCGLPWRLEQGGRHVKLVVGERLAGIMPMGAKASATDKDRRAVMNLRAQVRRVVKELKGGTVS
jgi:hypothetical protein